MVLVGLSTVESLSHPSPFPCGLWGKATVLSPYTAWRVMLPLLLFFFFFYCSGFCHTLKWISHGFTCVPHPDPPSPLPLLPIPLGLPSAPGLSACLMHPTWAGDLFHPIHVSMLFSLFFIFIFIFFFIFYL